MVELVRDGHRGRLFVGEGGRLQLNDELPCICAHRVDVKRSWVHAEAGASVCIRIPPGLFLTTCFGPSRRSRFGPSAPVPTSSGPTPLEPEPLATSLAEHFSSVPRTDPRGAGTSSQTSQAEPGEVRPVGPAQVREITTRVHRGRAAGVECYEYLAPDVLRRRAPRPTLAVEHSH